MTVKLGSINYTSVRTLGVALVGHVSVVRNFSVLVSLTMTSALLVALPSKIPSSFVHVFGRLASLGLLALRKRRC